MGTSHGQTAFVNSCLLLVALTPRVEGVVVQVLQESPV